MPEIKRILLGTTEICRQLYDLADAFRQLGYEADTIVDSANDFNQNLTYDYRLNPTLPFPSAIRNSANPIIRYPRGALNYSYRTLHNLRAPRFLTDYDLYVFQFAGSLMSGNRDFPILKKSGKKIISIFNGSDIRHWSATEPARKSFNLKSYDGYRDGAPLRNKLTAMRMAERYADVIFAQPSYAELAVRPYMHYYIAMNVSLYKHFVSGRDVPVVVHAPSRREIKGTVEILATLERLKSEGVKFELRLLEGMANSEVLENLQEADVVVDELNESQYGMLALEAMASGCAVAAGNRPDIVPLPPARPVVHLSPANVYAQLHRLLTDKQFRLQLAYQGLTFAEKYHDHLKVAQQMLQCLEPADGQRYDYYPDFFARSYELPKNEMIEDDLKGLTADVVRRWGLPEGIDPQSLVGRGLMSAIEAKHPAGVPLS